ncbi:acyltransferase ChoActase/COT/CPT [Catenaria anguillulae PL171]|uniref:Acyltransferase ChoActase/COT/CPT n=1 Tax=Catenaria anguillulae PL171 TaxID=765915 RepID=A0A1Y2HLI0_9FUNG|nr:acyltransferase ChoActase/COT/CPT [Catenaria anguillulae PL171]
MRFNSIPHSPTLGLTHIAMSMSLTTAAARASRLPPGAARTAPAIMIRARALATAAPGGAPAAGPRFVPGQMLARQAEVPRLPIPTLESSAKYYLASVRPLVDDKAYTATERAVKDFIHHDGGIGQELQRRLIAHDQAQQHSWLEDFWLKYAYLIWRCPTMLNVNWWCQFVDPVPGSIPNLTVPTTGAVPPKGQFTDVQLARAAGLVAGFLDANAAIQSAALPVDTIKGKPLCMNQYTKLFGGTRTPKTGCDSITTPWPTNARHILVLVRDQIFKLPILGDKGQRPSVATIHDMLKSITRLATTATPQPPVGLLTAEDRDLWAKSRLDLELASDRNRTTFRDIDSALFAVALDDSTGGLSPEATHGQIFHNHGRNRWFDKPIVLCVLPTGRAGVNGEHTPSDAVVPGAVFNAVLAQEANIHAARTKGATVQLPEPTHLTWDVPAPVSAALKQAESNVAGAVGALRSCILHEGNGRVGGSDWIKQQAKTSPDSYAQMALQLAYFRDLKHVPATYESASTRGFLHGRTECVRSQSVASKKFVEAWDRRDVSDKEKVAMFREAASVHQATMRQASQGLGCDRHWLGLKLMVKQGEDTPAMFADPSFALSQTFRLSTSNMSPGKYLYGGFGAVTANGYGVNYAVDPEGFKFSVSSWAGSETEAERMRDTLKVTLEDLYKVVGRVE